MQKERSTTKSRRDEEGLEEKEDEGCLDIVEDIEDSTLNSGGFDHKVKQVTPVQKNETPHIKETHPKVSKTIPRVTHLLGAFNTLCKLSTSY